MSINRKEITYEQAKNIAYKTAFDKLNRYSLDENIPLLSEEYKEAENCWFFFRNKKVYGPPEEELRWSCAYAVSKKGELRTIADFSEETEKLIDYLQVMSDYFKQKNL
ncbi:hypothetical protein QCD85_23190 [Paenibacillus sp. PsM32]|uniref:hypothetical protein n=1 Tax=Paenibacillus sp. PsM32 TaxID=3030536 RepID=UPI00263AB001|nr:hypothetical protein [Paenibacillus sp. PsM32]MDN4621042.1 hypothetical protein [Paenibacillus sp. PsM32]